MPKVSSCIILPTAVGIKEFMCLPKGICSKLVKRMAYLKLYYNFSHFKPGPQKDYCKIFLYAYNQTFLYKNDDTKVQSLKRTPFV